MAEQVARYRDELRRGVMSNTHAHTLTHTHTHTHTHTGFFLHTEGEHG